MLPRAASFLFAVVAGASAALSCGSPPPAAPPRPVLAIVGVTVVHPTRDGADAIERDRTILVEGERITVVGPASTPVPAHAKVVDARGKWIVPGLVDTHVHFFQSGNPFTRPDVIDLRGVVPYATEVARNKARLHATFKRWLATGVTTVADVGGPNWNFDVRDASRSGLAPRVFVAGPLLSMVAREKLDLGDPPIVKVTTPDEARLLAQKDLARKPDFVKAWFIHQPSDDLAKQEQIVRAGAEAAHAANVRFCVHATELDVAKAALRAGADILVHSVFDAPVDPEFIALAKNARAIYTPTLFVIAGYALVGTGRWTATEAERRLADRAVVEALEHTKIPEGAASEKARERWAAIEPNAPPRIAAANLRAVWDAGITVAMGTDAGNIGTVHGPSVFREIDFMAKSGLTPKDILLASTANGARFVGMEKELGEIAPGMLADLLVLDADPLADSANLARAFRVVKGGELLDPVELVESR